MNPASLRAYLFMALLSNALALNLTTLHAHQCDRLPSLGISPFVVVLFVHQEITESLQGLAVAQRFFDDLQQGFHKLHIS